MKKFIYIILSVMVIAALAACSPSNIKAEESNDVPEGMKYQRETTTIEFKKITETPSVPDEVRNSEGAGPGWTQIDPNSVYSNYPADKQAQYETPEDEANDTLVCLTFISNGALAQSFELIEVCDAQGLIDALVDEGVLKSGAKVVSFDNKDGSAVLELSGYETAYYKESDTKVLSCVANTFMDNLPVEAIKITANGKDYGDFDYTY